MTWECARASSRGIAVHHLLERVERFRTIWYVTHRSAAESGARYLMKVKSRCFRGFELSTGPLSP